MQLARGRLDKAWQAAENGRRLSRSAQNETVEANALLLMVQIGIVQGRPNVTASNVSGKASEDLDKARKAAKEALLLTRSFRETGLAASVLNLLAQLELLEGQSP